MKLTIKILQGREIEVEVSLFLSQRSRYYYLHFLGAWGGNSFGRKTWGVKTPWTPNRSSKTPSSRQGTLWRQTIDVLSHQWRKTCSCPIEARKIPRCTCEATKTTLFRWRGTTYPERIHVWPRHKVAKYVIGRPRKIVSRFVNIIKQKKIYCLRQFTIRCVVTEIF